MNEVHGWYTPVGVCVYKGEGGRGLGLPLDFLKEEMLQEMHRTVRPVLAFTQGACTQG